jgi:hypothetical protein
MRSLKSIAPALAGLFVLLSLTVTKAGLPVSAEGQDPVGAWAIVAHIAGQPDDFSLATIHSDGTLVASDPPMILETTPSGVLSRTFASAGHGVWVKQAGSLPGDRSYSLTFIEMSTGDAGGTPSLVKIRATITLSETGDTFSGPFAYSVAATDGRVLYSGQGTVDARRIGVEPLP